TSRGEVFTWGSNRYGQLGYALPPPPTSSCASTEQADHPVQLTPRQIFNPLKRECVVGAAASATHTVLHTASALYTFGKNAGQLGFMDADARALEFQTVPRKVGAALLRAPIRAVAASELATAVVLDSGEAYVFTRFGYSRLLCRPDPLPALFSRNYASAARAGQREGVVVQVATAGAHVVALSSTGTVYATSIAGDATAAQSGEYASPSIGSGSGSPTGSSTTNPSKLRNAVPVARPVWTPSRAHMAARDVAVGKDGSIILCTESGSAWRSEAHASRGAGAISGAISGTASPSVPAPAHPPFERVPGLSRVVAVRSNAFGAYAAVQKSPHVRCPPMRKARSASGADESLCATMARELDREADLRLGSRGRRPHGDVLAADEDVMRRSCRAAFERFAHQPDLVWLGEEGCDIAFPFHVNVLRARSPVLATALNDFTAGRRVRGLQAPLRELRYRCRDDGTRYLSLTLTRCPFLSLLTLWVWVYTDRFPDICSLVKRGAKDQLFRQPRQELIALASLLELETLERALRTQGTPAERLPEDLRAGLADPHFFDEATVVINLANGESLRVHQSAAVHSSDFFKAVFCGPSEGRWLAQRRRKKGGVTIQSERHQYDDDGSGSDVHVNMDCVSFDFRHVSRQTFELVRRAMYTDCDEHLFDGQQCETLAELVDLVFDVLCVANELMMYRLTLMCQRVLATFVNTSNVCNMLNAMELCLVGSFKKVALEYIVLNLEAMLERRLLDELDEAIMRALDDVTRCMQQPRRFQGYDNGWWCLGDPDLTRLSRENRRRLVDMLRLPSRLHEDEAMDERLRRLNIAAKEQAGNANRIAETGSDGRVSSHLEVSGTAEGSHQGDRPVSSADVSSPKPVTTNGIAGSSAQQPWKLATPGSAKTPLSDIMAQASDRRHAEPHPPHDRLIFTSAFAAGSSSHTPIAAATATPPLPAIRSVRYTTGSADPTPAELAAIATPVRSSGVDS
ncbi:hypothetical protein KEM52_000025, partial [Ascosphaera acerosa]